jgi:hypothetical protein
MEKESVTFLKWYKNNGIFLDQKGYFWEQDYDKTHTSIQSCEKAIDDYIQSLSQSNIAGYDCTNDHISAE